MNPTSNAERRGPNCFSLDVNNKSNNEQHLYQSPEKCNPIIGVESM